MRTLILFAILASPAIAQTDKPKPPVSPVEQVLATALKTHPDIKVAEAKLRLVQVELEQAKVHAIQEVTAAELKVQAAKQGLDAVESALGINLKLRDKGSISNEQVRAAETAVIQARGGVLATQQNLDAAKTQPGLKVIEARLALAAAEVEQARLQVTKSVTLAQAAVQNGRVAVEESSQTLDLLKKAGGAQLEMVKYAIDLRNAKAQLATAEAELAVAIGSGMKTEADATLDKNALRLKYLRFNEVKVVAPAGTAADKLRAALDKPIKLDMKATAFSDLMPEFLKQAGLDGMTVRYPTWATKEVRSKGLIGSISTLTGEKSLGAWLELILDEFNSSTGVPPDLGFAPPYIVVVREYGLLIVPKATAPPDAITLTEFAKAVKAEKAAADDTKAAPKK